MFEVTVTRRFYAKSEEQAQLIQLFMVDVAALVTCESSYVKLEQIKEVDFEERL